jgi:hypothetical protein
MRNKLNNRRGSALALVIVVMAVLMILGTTVLRIAVAENKFAKHNEDKIQAYYAARSGAQSVAEYLIRDANNDAEELLGKTSEWNEQLDRGKFQVTVNELSSDTIEIVSLGEYNGIQQKAKILLKKNSGGVFEHALVGKEIIQTDGSSGQGIDIYGTIATQILPPSLDDSKVDIIVDGVDIGVPDSSDPTLVFPEIIEPSSYYHSFTNNYSVVTKETLRIDGSPTNAGVTVIDKNGNVTIIKKVNDAGPIYIRALDLDVTGNGSNLEIVGGPVHLYLEGDLTIGTQGKFNVHSGGKLYIYVMGEQNVEFSGAGSYHGVFVYAPESIVSFQNAQPNMEFEGAIIGDKVILKNNLTFKYNKDMISGVNLDTSNVGVWNAGYTWID